MAKLIPPPSKALAAEFKAALDLGPAAAPVQVTLLRKQIQRLCRAQEEEGSKRFSFLEALKQPRVFNETCEIFVEHLAVSSPRRESDPLPQRTKGVISVEHFHAFLVEATIRHNLEMEAGAVYLRFIRPSKKKLRVSKLLEAIFLNPDLVRFLREESSYLFLVLSPGRFNEGLVAYLQENDITEDTYLSDEADVVSFLVMVVRNPSHFIPTSQLMDRLLHYQSRRKLLLSLENKMPKNNVDFHVHPSIRNQVKKEMTEFHTNQSVLAETFYTMAFDKKSQEHNFGSAEKLFDVSIQLSPRNKVYRLGLGRFLLHSVTAAENHLSLDPEERERRLQKAKTSIETCIDLDTFWLPPIRAYAAILECLSTIDEEEMATEAELSSDDSDMSSNSHPGSTSSIESSTS